MNIEELYFAAFNIAVIPAWLLLLFAPKWLWTSRIVHGVWVPGLLCAAWIGIWVFKPSPPEGAGIGTLEQFMLFVSSPFSALQIWVQLIVWDLFVGAWVARDALRKNIPHGFVVPCLLGVFIFPPSGLFLYFLIRFLLRRTFTLNEMAA